MNWSELITIYLALGAPFAVARFLSTTGMPRRQRTAKLAVAGAAWPLLLAHWSIRQVFKAPPATALFGPESDARSARADVLQRRIRAAAVAIREDGLEGFNAGDGEFDLLAVRLRESLTEYVGLTLLVDGNSESGLTGAPGLEFARAAGVPVPDQLPVALCLRRRNTARIERHRAQARRDLIQDLTAVEAAVSRRLTVAGPPHPTRQACATLLASAVELFELFQDTEAARIAVLLSRGGSIPAQNKGEVVCSTRVPTQTLVQR